MSTTKLRCIFCYDENGENILASSEHLFSRPVAEAFGFDRNQPIARTDADFQNITVGTLSGLKYRCVCTRCNSGWMNQLEQKMPLIAEWLQGSPFEPLGDDRTTILRRWAIKTHVMFCFIEGRAGRFMEEAETGNAIVTPATLGKDLYYDNTSALSDVTIGLSIAREQNSSSPTWTFGWPKVTKPNPSLGWPRFAPVTVVSIGRLRLWIVSPYLPARVRMPFGVKHCEPSTTTAKLTFVPQPRSPEIIRVEFT